MLCRNPFMQGMHAYPCRQCFPCRLNRRRLWTHRIILESLCHSANAFVTLTYAEDALPAGASLNPSDLRNWLKRFRKRISPSRVRFYAVGEYGDDTQRPHYHAALFGYPGCDCGAVNRLRPLSRPANCAHCSLVSSTWSLGLVDVGHLTPESAQYIAGYVVKKMTMRDDPRLAGREPEFARMSLRPGIGLNAMHDVASTILQFNLDSTQADVPVSLRHGKKELPLGTYLRQQLRTMIGKEKNAPQSSLDELAQKVHGLYLASKSDPAFYSIKEALIAETAQTVRSIEARNIIFKGVKKL